MTIIIVGLSILLAMSCILLANTRNELKEQQSHISSLYGGINKSEHNEKIIDSLSTIINDKIMICDSLQAELDVANFKLERIKYYNDIAVKGNNIKFLRGWINRVIND